MSDQHHEGLPRWAWGALLSTLTLALIAATQVGETSPVRRFAQKLEWKALDTMFQLRADWFPTQPDERIEIVVVDDEGLEYFDNYSLIEGGFPDQGWPWPRMFYGKLLEYLHAAGAKAVFFDFLFTGPSNYNLVAELLEEPTDDEQLARACAEAGFVYQSLLFGQPDGWEALPEGSRDFLRGLLHRRLEEYDLTLLDKDVLKGGVRATRTYESVQLPLPEYVAGARGLGAVNAEIDADGVVRRVRPVFEFREQVFPSIQLALAMDLRDERRVTSLPDGRLQFGEEVLPLLDDGSLLINWHGGAQTYPYHSMHKLVEQVGAYGPKEFTPDPRFRDKVILVGTSAAGLADLKANPFGSRFPGVEAHAAALDNMLNADYLRRGSDGLRWGWMIFLVLLSGQILMQARGAATSPLLALAPLALQLGFGFGLFVWFQIWVDQVVPVTALVLLFAGAQTVHYFTEGRQKRAIRGAFQRYLPPTVVDEVLKVPLDELKLGGDRRELTVLFSDIRGFTGISESLAPEELVSMLNVYLGEMTEIISQRHGTLDKYIGDCIMAFWGAPLAVDHPAIEACLSALEKQDRLEDMRRRLREKGLPELYARVGINTGPMLVGNMGSDQHFSYTVMGDAVNLASRLEGAGKQYGVSILIGARTEEAAREAIETREIDLLRVKGKQEPERVFELMARRGQLSPEGEQLREAFQQGLAAYRAQDWSGAQARFEAALALDPEDGPSRVYLERSRLYSEDPPPPDWDGVFVMATK